MPHSNSSLTRNQELSRVGNTRTDRLTFNLQVLHPTYRFGVQILTGGKALKLRERTLLTLEEE
jgi:hypothetical protein